jgi:hypothetical protein
MDRCRARHRRCRPLPWRETVVGATLAVLCAASEALAQGRAAEDADEVRSEARLALPEGPAAAAPDEVLSEDARRFRSRLVLWGAPAAVAAYGAAAWWDGGFGTFHTVSEGWFGADTYSGGADKLGHGFSAYVGTRVVTWALEWAGNDHEDSIRMASLLSLGTFVAIEMFDGFTEQYGFSHEDALAGIAGVALGYAQERYPALDDVLDFRVRYRRSDDAKRLGEADPVSDYSGQTFFVVAKAAGFPSLRHSPWTRYLEFAVGYGTRGYEPNDGRPMDPHRLLYAGVSLNLSEILNDTVFRGHRGGRAQRITNGVLEFVQVPATGAYAEHRF